MAAVRRGWVDVVVCFKLDRLGRSLSHLAQIIDEFNTHKVALVVPAQGIDTSDDNPAGKLQLHILSAVAEFEREIMHHFSGLSLCNSKVILRGGFSCNATRVGGGQLARNREKLSFKAGGKHALSQRAWAARHGHRKFFSSPGMATLCSHHSTQCHCVGECRWGPSILMARCISVMSRLSSCRATLIIRGAYACGAAPRSPDRARPRFGELPRPDLRCTARSLP
jgi:hypothetical protein